MNQKRTFQTVFVVVVVGIFSLCYAGTGMQKMGASDDCNVPCINVESPQMKHFSRKYGKVVAKRCGGSINKIEIIQGKTQKGTPAEIADMVMVDSGKAFGFDPKSMQKIFEMEGPNGTRIKYCQTYQGIQVFNTCLIVKIDKENRVTKVQCKTKNNIFASTKPQLNEQQAMQQCKSAHGIQGDMSLLKDPSLMVFSAGEKSVLVWRFLHSANEPTGTWESLVSAQDGTLILTRDLLDH